MGLDSAQFQVMDEAGPADHLPGKISTMYIPLNEVEDSIFSHFSAESVQMMPEAQNGPEPTVMCVAQGSQNLPFKKRFHQEHHGRATHPSDSTQSNGERAEDSTQNAVPEGAAQRIPQRSEIDSAAVASTSGASTVVISMYSKAELMDPSKGQ